MKRSTILFIGISLIVFVLALMFVINKSSLTGNFINNSLDNYSYTKAICNDGKCIDVFVSCENGKVSTIKPVSELIQFNVSEINPDINNNITC